MPQLRGCTSLAQETLAMPFRQKMRMRYLERHLAIKLRIVCPVDAAERTHPQSLPDFKAADSRRCFNGVRRHPANAMTRIQRRWYLRSSTDRLARSQISQRLSRRGSKFRVQRKLTLQLIPELGKPLQVFFGPWLLTQFFANQELGIDKVDSIFCRRPKGGILAEV